MFKMKTQNYLTPSQVEELRELGVEFETRNEGDNNIERQLLMIWVRNHNNSYSLFAEDMVSEFALKSECIIAAPSLQEVLDKLPDMHFVKSNPAWFNMTKLAGRWSIGYRYADKPDGRFFRNANPLLAALELLKWVAKNHPESLTDKTE